jgi:mRNA interferase RelE/StbE
VTPLDPDEPYELVVAASASRAIADHLPEPVAWAAIDFINGPLLSNPYRVGAPLENELAGLYGHHLADYRIVYHIDDENCVVEVLRIGRRADIYGLGEPGR